MAILECNAISQTLKGSRKNVRTYTVVWQVITDDPLEPLLDVVAATGVSYNQVLADDPSCFFVDYACDMVESTNDNNGVFNVTLTYSNEPIDTNETGTSQSPPSESPGESGQDVAPTDRNWTMDISFVNVTYARDEDEDGEAVVNSAGQKFDPPVEFEDFELVVTLTGWKAIGADSESNANYYIGSINDATFRGHGARTCKCTQYTIASTYESGAWYWKKTFAYQVRSAGWNPTKILDQGTVAIDSMNMDMAPQPIKDASGNPITTPVPLNAGHVLSATDVVAGNFQYKEFNFHREVSWSTII